MASAKIKELIEEISKLLPNNAEDIKGDFKDNLKILLNDYLTEDQCCDSGEIRHTDIGLVENKKKT